VPSPKECRQYADECIGRARAARSEKERDIFLEMARTWLGAALNLEKGLERIDEHYAKSGDHGMIEPKASETRGGEGKADDCSPAISHALSVATAIAAGRTAEVPDEMKPPACSETEDPKESGDAAQVLDGAKS
jgi:hypothetical protein